VQTATASPVGYPGVEATLTAEASGVAASGRVLVVSNFEPGNSTILTEFSSRMPGIELDTMDVTVQTPTLAFLATFQAVLVYEDGLFANALSVGDVIYDYVQAGGNVVIGTFYWQDRSDNSVFGSPGWGNLEMIDPFLGPLGSEYDIDDLDPASIVAHPLTAGVNTLSVTARGFHGGVAAKEGTTVVASWSDGVPLIGYRTEPGGQRLVAVSVYPAYEWYGNYSGDLYVIWENALRFALGGTVPDAPPAVVAAQGLQIQRAVPAQQASERSAGGGTPREN
jgi:hypothetical protein